MGLGWYFVGVAVVAGLLGALHGLLDRYNVGWGRWWLEGVVDVLVVLGWAVLVGRLWPGTLGRGRRRKRA